MKKTDLSQAPTKDLQEKLAEEKNALDKMRFSHAISPAENPMRIHLARKTIARMMTELRKRELSEATK
jgi:large subunit ribosomal protein L29